MQRRPTTRGRGGRTHQGQTKAHVGQTQGHTRGVGDQICADAGQEARAPQGHDVDLHAGGGFVVGRACGVGRQLHGDWAAAVVEGQAAAQPQEVTRDHAGARQGHFLQAHVHGAKLVAVARHAEGLVGGHGLVGGVPTHLGAGGIDLQHAAQAHAGAARGFQDDAVARLDHQGHCGAADTGFEVARCHPSAGRGGVDLQVARDGVALKGKVATDGEGVGEFDLQARDADHRCG